MSGRVLVTGGDGFVGTHLTALLTELGQEVVAPTTDITDGIAFAAMVADVQPTAVYHLAALASVGDSWSAVSNTYLVNTIGTVNVLDAVSRLARLPRTLVVSSAEVYGPAAFAASGGAPISESVQAQPASPYGGSKLAAENAAQQAARGRGVPVVIARSFNHVGAGQSDGFVVSAIAKQIAEAEVQGLDHIKVGNLAAARDFLDVADVVRAYCLLVQSDVASGLYNVASGESVPVTEVVRLLTASATIKLSVEIDPQRFRPVDVPVVIGDATRLRADTGWTPASSWQRGALACLDHWRTVVASSKGP